MTASTSAGRGLALSPAAVASGVQRTEVTITADGVRWLEHDFDRGRSRVMHAAPSAAVRAVTPDGVDVGSLSWEYGGASYLVTAAAVIYADRDDQRLYRLAADGSPAPITPTPDVPRGERFADGDAAPDGRWAAYVRESHLPEGAVRHALVAVDLAGERRPRTLAHGEDFYMAPRISPDGRRLAWISWRKPRMAWDGTELWLADVAADLTMSGARRVAGSATESVLAPSWSSDGALHWVSDRSGWWNLYALRDGAVSCLCREAAEYAVVPWQYGRRSYGFLAGGAIAAVRVRDGIHDVVRIPAQGGRAEVIAGDLTAVTDGHLSCHGRTVALCAATPVTEAAVLAIDAHTRTRTVVAAEASDDEPVVAGTAIRIPGPDGEEAHGFWYPPARPAASGGPPLVLHLHGGPTDAATLARHDELQLWTSRGFAVLDLNYSGSSGFGSAYRHRLDGAWGDRDLADCVAAVSHLSAEGLIDPDRVLARGASAGGYLTLRCVTAADLFRAGLARCAIADLGLWREDAHDFESRYPDVLVGPPSRADEYRGRSPARGAGPRSAPLLLVHGLADRVVPPEHARRMATAYEAAGRPYRLELLEGEPHGLRRADSRRQWLEAELDFAAAHDVPA